MSEVGGKLGRAKSQALSLEAVSGWDKEEDFTIAGANQALNSGTMPDGTQRNRYYARGIHNFGATDSTVKYNVYDDSTTRTMLVKSGADKKPLVPIKTILSTTTNPSSLKVYYKDKNIIDGVGEKTI